MTQDKIVPFHKIAKGILGEFEAVEGGPKLSDDALRKWASQILAASQKRLIGEQLVAVAMRFSKAGAELAMDQVIVLATLALGKEEEVAAQLEAGGMAKEEAQKLTVRNQSATKGLEGGLAPPSGGKGMGGVGLRKRR